MRTREVLAHRQRRRVARPVTEFGLDLEAEVAHEGPQVLLDAPGTGLAAPQLGRFAADRRLPPPGDDAEPAVRVLVNPEFVFASRVLQHELDHLDGILILDRLSRAARRRYLAGLRPALRAAAGSGAGIFGQADESGGLDVE
jgi:peptide deformylase